MFYVDFFSHIVFSMHSAENWLPVTIRLSVSMILLFIFWKKPKKSLVAEAIVSGIIGGISCLIITNAINNGL
jgi:lipoprotein signal peptidase